MKKLILFTVALIVSLSSFGQEFLGVKPEGTKSEVIQQFKSKGFTVKDDDGGDVVILTGSAAGKDVQLLIVSSPTSKTVWKFVVYLPKKYSWTSLKGEYLEFMETLTTKYGKPKDTYEFFSSPYKEGDGYEMTGVGIGKSNYAAFWPEELGLAIEISKTEQVKITYENSKNYEISKSEKEALKKNAF